MFNDEEVLGLSVLNARLMLNIKVLEKKLAELTAKAAQDAPATS